MQLISLVKSKRVSHVSILFSLILLLSVSLSINALQVRDERAVNLLNRRQVAVMNDGFGTSISMISSTTTSTSTSKSSSSSPSSTHTATSDGASSQLSSPIRLLSSLSALLIILAVAL